MRKVFLDDLPKENGKGANKDKLVVRWRDSIGYIIKFIYDDIEGYFKILHYNSNKSYLLVEYNGNNEKIYIQRLINCNFDNIVKEEIINWDYNIGDIIKDEKRDIVIIDRKTKLVKRKSKCCKNGYTNRNLKYYKYKCNLCGFDGGKHWNIRNKEYKNEYWIEENGLDKNGCACCHSDVIAQGINDIPTTAPWMVKYFQGGYEEAKLYTKNSSNKSIYPICPDCGRIRDKKVIINNIYKYHSMGCTCSDNVSYGEKLIFNVLHQLKIKFQTQLSKSTFEWCKNYRYDFYFEYNNEKYICEVHGSQHYEKGFDNCGGRTLDEEIENDRNKKELAINNGIKESNYIIIDARKSELEWIRDNDNGILNSRLNELFNLSKIDWLKVIEYACSNLVKIACEHKRDNPNLNCAEIGELMNGVWKGTIYNWLKQGNGVWCIYNPEEERKRSYAKNINRGNTSKLTAIFKNDICLRIFNSALELSENSNDLFGVKLYQGTISAICRGVKSKYKGYTFKYIKDLTEEEYIKYDIENKLNELHNQELVQAS